MWILIVATRPTKIYNILKGSDSVAGAPPGQSGQFLLGQPICLRGVSKLLGIGSARRNRLRRAASSGDACPLDGRLRKAKLPKKYMDGPQNYKRELIHQFLLECYTKHAEPMPEVHSGPGSRQQTDSVVRFRVRKGKRPRRFAKRDEPLDNAAAVELRILPPGTYTDCLPLFQAQHSDCKVGFKLFTRVA